MATYQYVESKIKQGLHKRLLELTLDPPVPVAWPNMNFNAAGKAHLRVALLPARTRQEELGDSAANVHLGIYQVTVFYPVNKGEFTPTEIAGAVADHFPRGHRISSGGIIIRIDGPPWIDPGLQEEDFYYIPVNIPYVVDSEG